MVTHSPRIVGEDAEATAKRKGEHIRICLEEEVGAVGVQSGFERYRFLHNALPELSFDSISLETFFWAKNCVRRCLSAR